MECFPRDFVVAAKPLPGEVLTQCNKKGIRFPIVSPGDKSLQFGIAPPPTEM
jgi:hypothetical protein